jgi:hypothetical protein
VHRLDFPQFDKCSLMAELALDGGIKSLEKAVDHISPPSGGAGKDGTGARGRTPAHGLHDDRDEGAVRK